MRVWTRGAPTHFLSHILAVDTPAYGGGDGFHEEAASRIADGQTANSSVWRFPNHIGTHLDAPRHFFDAGQTIDSIPPADWWFDHPQLMNVPVANDELVLPRHLPDTVDLETDLLLLRTGFEAHRGEPRYWQRNPGLSAELAHWIRQGYPLVRAVGMDTISVTSRAHRPEGRVAHRAFLDPEGPGSPLILIEDMALAHAPARLTVACVAPLRVHAGNGGPCTVLAWADDTGSNDGG